MAVTRNPFFRFLIQAVTLYALWYALYEFILKPSTGLDEWIISQLVDHTRILFGILGVELQEAVMGLSPDNWIALPGSPGVIVAAPCDGLVLFALFTVFIIAFPGAAQHKLWFIPLGVLLIHLVNVARVFALVNLVAWKEEWLQFNHDYTFTILVYGFIFLLWYIWINRFSPLRMSNSNQV